MDNHTAEWAACIYALEHARELNVQNALLYTDSKIIADSIEAGYEKRKFQNAYFNGLKILKKILIYYLLNGYEREQNKEANQHTKRSIN